MRMPARIVRPEILDSLPHDSEAALRNRRDILWINRLAGSFRWFRRRLQAQASRFPRGSVFVELGAGDGRLGLSLKPLMESCGWRICGVDLAPRPASWPAGWDWMQEDLTRFRFPDGTAGVLANLILHQFPDTVLEDRFASLPKHLQLVLANEPHRSARSHFLAGLLRPFLSSVSRHDAAVSIDAGFLGNELPGILKLDRRGWIVQLEDHLLGHCRLEARRVPSD